MTILWVQDRDGVHYEVRGAGRTRRLYTNGVLHTQYHPGRPVTGSVWDLLLLTAFFREAGNAANVLVLGVGGGAVIRLLSKHVAPDSITGVEYDALHITIARRFFGIDDRRVSLHCADARDWIRAYRGRPFDLVIDDLFCGQDSDPVRAVPVDRDWFDCLDRHVATDGVLAINFPDRAALLACALCTEPALLQNYATRFQLATPSTENRVAVLCRGATDTGAVRERTQRIPALRNCLRNGSLRYSIRTLAC
jgi:Spermine/spermidine synthase domain